MIKTCRELSRPEGVADGHARCHERTAFRHPDHRRRSVGHRHGRSVDRRVSGQDHRDPGAPRAPRRHLGPVPLPRYPLRLGHAHLRLQVAAVARAQGARRRAVDPPVHRRHRRRVRRRREDPVRAEDRRRGLVERREPLDGHRGARGDRRDPPLHVRLPDQLYRLLQLRRRLSAELPRRRAVHRAAPSIRSTGRRTSITRARRSSSSAAARPQSRWFRRCPATRRT